MKIFISHSLSDKNLIVNIKTALEPFNLELLIAEHQINYDGTITAKIESMIRNCDFALIMLTKAGTNSKFVQQEIGYITSQRKQYVQVVEKGLDKEIAGFNYGRDYIELDSDNPQYAISKITEILINVRNERMRQQYEREERERKQAQVELGFLAGAIVLAWLNE